MPCIYYGDEAGLEGCKDPFNRGTFPWGREDRDLVDFFRELGKLRKENPVLRYGNVEILSAGGGQVTLRRTWQNESVTAEFNASDLTWKLT